MPRRSNGKLLQHETGQSAVLGDLSQETGQQIPGEGCGLAKIRIPETDFQQLINLGGMGPDDLAP